MKRAPSLLVVSLVVISLTGVAFAKKGGGGGGGRGYSSPPPPPPKVIDVALLNSDRKDINDAQTALTKAATDYNTAVAKLTADFQQTPDYVADKKAFDDATADATAAHDAVMQKLADDPKYKDAKAKEKDAQAMLDALREKNAPQDLISEKATAVYKAGQITDKMERSALDGDSAYTAAQAKLTTANKTLSDLRAKFKDSLKADPTITPLLQARTDAQARLTAAQTKLASDSH